MNEFAPDPASVEPLDADLVPESPARPSRPRWRILGAVAVGGAIGAPLRYGLELLLVSPAGGFPVATFVINVTGAFVLGALVTLIVERWPPTTYLRPFAATGILGAYTTWSTFMVDVDELIEKGKLATAAGYVGDSLAAGLAAAYLGILLARRLGGPRR